MIAPCHECTERSSTCHANCKRYAQYAQYRQMIRDARQKDHVATSALIDGARKIKNEKFRKR